MNQLEQSGNPIKTLTAPHLSSQTRPAVHRKAQSLTYMLRSMRDNDRAEELVWGILGASAVVILLVSAWI
jgi:hypothetical protein